MNPTDYTPKYKTSIYLNIAGKYTSSDKNIIILNDYYLYYIKQWDKIRVFPLNEIKHFNYKKEDNRIKFWATEYEKKYSAKLDIHINEKDIKDLIIKEVPEFLL